jgi:lipoprotein-releasing system ATP-binding protein
MNEPAVLTAHSLHKRFTEGHGSEALDVTVLRGLSLAVQRGETLAVVAPAARARARCCTCWAGWMRPPRAAWN